MLSFEVSKKTKFKRDGKIYYSVFFGRNDAEAEIPVLWPPHVKSWLFGKDSDAGRDWGQEEKGTTEDEMAGWHHWLDGRESEWPPGVGDGQGGLACCDSWGRRSDTTERLNWTKLEIYYENHNQNRPWVALLTWEKNRLWKKTISRDKDTWVGKISWRRK